LALALLGGCTTFGTDDASPDASADASPDAAAPQGEGFEADRAGCGDWEAKQGSTERTPTGGHSGPSACRVCSPGGKSDSFFGATRALVGAQPGTYSIEAYVRHVSGDPARLAGAFDADKSFKEGTEILAPSDWTLVTKSVTVVDGTSLRAVISGRSTSVGVSCFLVDDIVIRKDR
jgi:hypothetical protein